MASGSSSSHLNSSEPSSSSSSSVTEGRSGSRRRTIQPPSRFRQSPDKPNVPLPSSFSLPSSSHINQQRSTPSVTAPRARSKPAPAVPLPPTIKIKPSPALSAQEELTHHSLKLAATEHVDVGWPNRHNKGKVVEEDLKDKVLMAVCAALASIENKALCLQELAEICAEKGWIKPSPSLSVSSLVSAAIRSHYRRAAAASRPPLLSKHVLLGSASEINIAPALHPDSIKAERRPKGTIWFLSSDAGYWNPFERARVAHHLMKDGEGTKNSGATSKRKREEAVGSSSSVVGPSTSGGGLKIRLKVLGGLREEESTQHDVSMSGAGEDLGEGSSSLLRSLGSSSSGADPRSGGGRRQRGPKDGFPDFARAESDDEDDLSDDQTPTSSLPNQPDSHLHQHRPRFVPPKRLQARHSLPATSSSRSLPASFHGGNHRHSHRPAAGEDPDSSSSSEGEDFHEAMLRSDDFAFGMDEDRSGDGSGDTPATTPRDGGGDGLSDQQSVGAGVGKSAASASPPPRRSPFPPAPTPAEVLAGGPVPISADPNHIPTREPVNSLSSSELSDSNLLRHRLGTAPHSPIRPFNSDHLHPQSAPPAGALALPRMQALSPSPSPSPAMPSVLLPHLHSLPSFISHSSPSRLSFHQHLTSGIGSAPNSPSTETKEQEEAFNLTLSLLPTDFKPVIRDNRFAESSGEEFDDSESICVMQAEDASPPSDASGLFDDFGDVGGRENSLARSEDNPHRKAERWAMESSSSTGGIKLEPSSPRMLLMDEETASPREDGFSRDSSREGDDEGGDDEEDEETASGLLAALGGGGEAMDDEDEVDGNEDFLGPESVGLEELERVWGGGRRRGERCSPFSGFGGGDVGAVKLEDIDGDSRMETIEEMRKEKEAFAHALVEKARAATASMLSPEHVEDLEMDDSITNDPSTHTRVGNSLRRTSSSSSISKRRVASNSHSNDLNSTSRPTALPPKQKRRDSLLPKPLPAPVRRDYGHKRTNTASMIEMVGLLDVEDFDEMDLLFTPESGIGGRRAGSAARRSESVDASGMSSDVEYLGEGESSSMSGVPALVDIEASSTEGGAGGTNGGSSTIAGPKPPVARPLPRRSIFAPRPLDLPAVPAIPQLVQPVRQLSPNVNATCISGIPVFMCFFSNVVLLRRIDSEYVNMSTGLEALAIVGPGEEAKKKEILSPIQDHVVVEWGTSVGSGVNGIWVPLQVARGLALRFTAGSPLLSTFFDFGLANSFPPQLVEAALSQTLRSPSGFAIPPPRLPAPRPTSKGSSPLTSPKPTSSGSSPSSSKPSGLPRSNAPKPSSLSTSTVPSPVAKSKPKLKATPTTSTSSLVTTPSATETSPSKPVVEDTPKLPRTAIATAAKRAKKEAAAAAAAAAASSSSTSGKVKTKKPKKDRTPSTTAGLLWDSSSSLSEVEEEAPSRSHSPERGSSISADTPPPSRSTRRTSRVGGSK